MGKVKKAKRRRMVAHPPSNAAAARGGPTFVSKLRSSYAELCVEGCHDVMHLSATPRHAHTLRHYAAAPLLEELLNDRRLEVVTAAAAALCNTSLSVAPVSPESYAALDGALLCVLSRCVGFHACERCDAWVADNLGEERGENASCAPTAVRRGATELLHLATVVADGAADAVALWCGGRGSEGALPPLLLRVVQQSDIWERIEKVKTPCDAVDRCSYEVEIGAVELLRVMASDNPTLATFFSAWCLTDDARRLRTFALSSHTFEPCSEERRLSLELAALVLEVSPTVQTACDVIPAVVGMMQCTSPFREWAHVLPFLTEGCDVPEAESELKARQCRSRIGSLQVALAMASAVLSIVVDSCAEAKDRDAASMDDETAFQKNPNQFIVCDSLLPAAVALGSDSLRAPQETVLWQALFELTEIPTVCAVQTAVHGAEVGVLSLCAALLHLLPPNAVDPSGVLWSGCMSRLRATTHVARHLLDEAPEMPLTGRMHAMSLQVESLLELLWTVLRKLGHTVLASVQPSDLDAFTQVIQQPYCTPTAALFTVGAVSCFGALVAGEPSHSVTGRFLTYQATHGVTVEVRAEAANGIMDIFCDEVHDTTCYVPMQTHGALRQLSPILREYTLSLGKLHPQKAHLREIFSNLCAFLKYKERHNPQLAA